MSSTETESTTVKCRICHRPIKLVGGIWHEEGSFVFPQYCEMVFGGRLHEPEVYEPSNLERMCKGMEVEE